MTTTRTDPIQSNWSIPTGTAGISATATDVSDRLGQLEVTDIDAALLPFLAAAAAELASVAGISWRLGGDDGAAALLRLVAKATLKDPSASGPHTGRLLAQLR